MLSQGICASLYYNTNQTLNILEQMNCTENWLQLLFGQTQTVKQGYEIKRFVTGLSALMQRDQSELPQSVRNVLPNLMKALVILCEKSIIYRQEQLKKEKEEEAEEEQFDKGIYEEDDDCDIISNEDDDDDEDYDCNEELENLYFSKFDTLDEVIYFRDVFTGLEQQNNQMYNFHLGCLDQQELVSFQNSINTAIEYQQLINSQQAQ